MGKVIKPVLSIATMISKNCCYTLRIAVSFKHWLKHYVPYVSSILLLECGQKLTLKVRTRGVATAVSAISMIRGPNTCNYIPTNKALISEKGPERILIQDPLRTSYASGKNESSEYLSDSYTGNLFKGFENGMQYYFKP
ncbi:hypothetical protein TNCV_1265281 [Trichonephila clavipes]|nr:hypothetical protein TNCV_1265281 [Trichonephila clavipes]